MAYKQEVSGIIHYLGIHLTLGSSSASNPREKWHFELRRSVQTLDF